MADLTQEKNIRVFRAFGAFWKNYADFNSRTSKEAFWKAFFVQSAVLLAMFSPAYYVYESLIERDDISAVIWLVPLIAYSMATVVPMIAIIVRRLHDIDRSGAWFFLFLIPIAGAVVFFIMLSKPSAPFDVYPGMSGSGPYPPPRNPYAQPYAQTQNPYAQPYAQTKNPYAQYYRPPQYQYAEPYTPPRQYAPRAGGNKAAAAIILTIILAVATNAYSFVCGNYVQNNLSRLFGFNYYDALGGPSDGFFNDPYYWGEEPWDGSNPWGDDFWNDVPGFDQEPEGQMTEEEMAAIDFVRDGVLEGFPDFTIEEVLLSKVEDYSLEWECFNDEGGDYPEFYVNATGIAIGDFVTVYAGFDVYDDGTIELYNLNDGIRDEYGENAIEMYRDWYEAMFSDFDTAGA